MASRRVPYVRLGNSGLKVSKIILGCMSYGSPEWEPWVLPMEEAIKHIKFAYDAGIQTFDTANVYSNGMSEVVLGKAIKELQLPRDEIVVMTKVRGAVGKTTNVSAWELFKAGPDNIGYVNQHGLSRKHIFASVQDSLKRLQLDYIDVLQCHRFDYDTPIAETMEALHDVVKAGYVRYIGMSSCYAWQFHVMQNYAITHNLTPFISMQNQYSLIYREEEREMMPTLKHFGVGSIPWAPLARGELTRPLASEKTARQSNDATSIAYAQLSSKNTRSSAGARVSRRFLQSYHVRIRPYSV
ncbi:NADP-dependent oxidoreductase domain-containing protein, partial [Mycena sp. CBHHK59/15]